MKQTQPTLTSSQIEGVLCARYRAIATAMGTLSGSAAVAALFLYSETLQALPRDYVALFILAVLFAGWSYLWIERSRSAKRAADVAKIMQSNNFKPRLDQATGMVYLDELQRLNFGGHETDSVVQSAALTSEEAQKIQDLIALARAKEPLALLSGATQ